MNRYLKELTLVGGLVAAFFIGKALFSAYEDNRLEKQTILRTESEMRFKQLAKELFILKAQKDSLVGVNVALDSIIEVQRSSPSIIIRKTNEVHINISNLDAVNSIILFTNNLDKYNSNRGRYSLSRFDKGH